MSAKHDRDQLLRRNAVGATIEAVAVDQDGFLMLVIKPKRARTYRLLVTIARDHEMNGPGAALTEMIHVPKDGRVEVEPDGTLVIARYA
jgi:hypothetical protein